MDDDIFAHIRLHQGHVHLSGDTAEIDIRILTFNIENLPWDR
jgi:hypothetical protein